MELAKTTVKCRRFSEDFERFLCYLMLGQLSQASPTPSLSLSIWSLFFLYEKGMSTVSTFIVHQIMQSFHFKIDRHYYKFNVSE